MWPATRCTLCRRWRPAVALHCLLPTRPAGVYVLPRVRGAHLHPCRAVPGSEAWWPALCWASAARRNWCPRHPTSCWARCHLQQPTAGGGPEGWSVGRPAAGGLWAGSGLPGKERRWSRPKLCHTKKAVKASEVCGCGGMLTGAEGWGRRGGKHEDHEGPLVPGALWNGGPDAIEGGRRVWLGPAGTAAGWPFKPRTAGHCSAAAPIATSSPLPFKRASPLPSPPPVSPCSPTHRVLPIHHVQAVSDVLPARYIGSSGLYTTLHTS